MTTESRISLYRPMKQKDTCTGKKQKKRRGGKSFEGKTEGKET